MGLHLSDKTSWPIAELERGNTDSTHLSREQRGQGGSTLNIFYCKIVPNLLRLDEWERMDYASKVEAKRTGKQHSDTEKKRKPIFYTGHHLTTLISMQRPGVSKP